MQYIILVQIEYSLLVLHLGRNFNGLYNVTEYIMLIISLITNNNLVQLENNNDFKNRN